MKPCTVFLYAIFLFLTTLWASLASLQDDLSKLNFYTVLQISKSASTADVKKAYRRLSLLYHPDKPNQRTKDNVKERSAAARYDKDGAQHYFSTKRYLENISSNEDMFYLVKAANEVLSDEHKRLMYDRFGYEDLEDMIEYASHMEMISRFVDVDDLYFDTNNFPREPTSAPRDDPPAPASDVLPLGSQNFEQRISHSPHTWVVTFYHPNCDSCRYSVPVLRLTAERAAKRGLSVRLGAVNCAMFMDVCREAEIEQMGQILIFPPSQEPGGWLDKDVYAGPLSPEDILEAVSSMSISQTTAVTSLPQVYSMLRERPIVTTTALPVEAVALVAMMRPVCPPCRALKASLRKLSAELKGVIKFYTVNCDVAACPEAEYFPYLRLVVKRQGDSGLESIPLHLTEYQEASKVPSAFIIKVTGAIIRHVVQLNWKFVGDEQNNNKDYDGERLSEMKASYDEL